MRRHGEEPKDARLLSKLVDKTIRLHLLAVKVHGQAYLEKSALGLEQHIFQIHHKEEEERKIFLVIFF